MYKKCTNTLSNSFTVFRILLSSSVSQMYKNYKFSSSELAIQTVEVVIIGPSADYHFPFYVEKNHIPEN